MTGTTTVRREPEFDDRLRAEYLAAVALDEQSCSLCGNVDCIVEVPAARRHVTWDEYDGRVMDVRHFICLACGAARLIERDFTERQAKAQLQPGVASPSDGRRILAAPLRDR